MGATAVYPRVPVLVHLVDGTYELFRAHYGPAPGATDASGREVGGVRGFLRSMLALLGGDDVTHVGVAFDHVIESFRNQMFDGYKTGEGIEPELWNQFPLVERASQALGLVTWPMVEFEADDGIASAAIKYAKDDRVEQVLVCSPDKDFAQLVRDPIIGCFDRRKNALMNEAGVRDKFGVAPASIPDWLGLVGDTADGIPGIPRWGAKSTATVLSAYPHVEDIPDDVSAWEVKVRGAATLAANLRDRRDDAVLYRDLAVLRTDAPIPEDLDALEWRGADRQLLSELCDEIGDDSFAARVKRWRDE